jgi:hypothetical protein
MQSPLLRLLNQLIVYGEVEESNAMLSTDLEKIDSLWLKLFKVREHFLLRNRFHPARLGPRALVGIFGSVAHKGDHVDDVAALDRKR